MVKLYCNFIAFKCRKMDFELWACINGKNLISNWSKIAANLVWQRNFWSTMDFYFCLCRFQKWLQMSSKSTLKSVRSSTLRPTWNFCQSALLWPTKTTRRSKRCVFFPARQHQMNPYSFDLPKNIFFSTRILLTYECALCGLGQSNTDNF